MTFTFKKIFATLVLVSFLTVAFFGFVAMSYGPDGSMQGDCPFSSMGASLCPQGVLPGAIHHILGAQSFLNVPMNSGIMALIIALVSVVLIFVLSIHPFLFRLVPNKIYYDSPPFTSYNRKIKRWLSLHEIPPN